MRSCLGINQRVVESPPTRTLHHNVTKMYEVSVVVRKGRQGGNRRGKLMRKQWWREESLLQGGVEFWGGGFGGER